MAFLVTGANVPSSAVNQTTRGAKVRVSISIGQDFVREAETPTPDPCGTLAELLTTFVATGHLKLAEEQRSIDTVLAATADFVDQHGLPGADYMPV